MNKEQFDNEDDLIVNGSKESTPGETLEISVTPAVDTHLDGFVRDITVFDGLSPHSAAAYRRLIKEFWSWLAGNAIMRPVDQITTQDVEQYLEWCFYRGNGNNTRLTKLTALRRYGRFLRRNRIVPADWDITREIPKPKVRKIYVKKFNREEAYAIFRSINRDKEMGLRDVVIFILAFFCGLRAGEICRLRIESIQDDGKLIDIVLDENIVKQGGGGSEGRTMTLWAVPSRDVRRYLDIRLRFGATETDPFIPTYDRKKRQSNKSFNGSMLDSVIKKYAKRAGLHKKKKTLHMCRATFGWALRHVDGYDPLAISREFGHANIAQTDRYLPDRSRLTKKYKSKAAFWSDYETLWDKKTEGGVDGGTDREQPLE